MAQKQLSDLEFYLIDCSQPPTTHIQIPKSDLRIIAIAPYSATVRQSLLLSLQSEWLAQFILDL